MGETVTCQRCERTYTPTPLDDFYDDAFCFGCLLAEKAPVLVGKPHLVAYAGPQAGDEPVASVSP